MYLHNEIQHAKKKKKKKNTILNKKKNILDVGKNLKTFFFFLQQNEI